MNFMLLNMNCLHSEIFLKWDAKKKKLFNWIFFLNIIIIIIFSKNIFNIKFNNN